LSADVAAEMFHERGVATLTEILDAGRLLTDADDDELSACAMLVGGVWLGPAIATSEGRTAADILGDYFGGRLAHELFVADPDSVAVGELRDLEWAYTLMTDEATAHRLLETLPSAMRDLAESSAARTWQGGGEAVVDIVRDVSAGLSRFRSAS
jgi:hypothetical protein